MGGKKWRPRTLNRRPSTFRQQQPVPGPNGSAPPRQVANAGASMNFGAPWSVAGIRADARETAKEAARRSGMSVGEWLNSVIDIAAGANVQVAQQAAPRPVNMSARDAMAGMQERLDNLSRQIEALARESGQRSWAATPDEAQGWRFQSAISQFDERLERLMAE